LNGCKPIYSDEIRPESGENEREREIKSLFLENIMSDKSRCPPNNIEERAHLAIDSDLNRLEATKIVLIDDADGTRCAPMSFDLILRGPSFA